MTNVSGKERIAAIELRLKQLKARQQRKDAKARSVEAKRFRREEMRRKFLLGAVVLAKVESGELRSKP